MTKHHVTAETLNEFRELFSNFEDGLLTHLRFDYTASQRKSMSTAYSITITVQTRMSQPDEQPVWVALNLYMSGVDEIYVIKPRNYSFSVVKRGMVGFAEGKPYIEFDTWREAPETTLDTLRPKQCEKGRAVVIIGELLMWEVVQHLSS